MKADMKAIEIILVLLVEFLFGIGYNLLVAWWHKHRFSHVSISVAIGVMGTLVIPLAFWFDVEMRFWEAGLLLLACFTASGVPMIVGSMKRTAARKDNKKRRPWPNEAKKMRDLVVMELSAMAHEIAEQAKSGELTVRDLPDFVDRLHGVIGTLKSV